LLEQAGRDRDKLWVARLVVQVDVGDPADLVVVYVVDGRAVEVGDRDVSEHG
jgi:hypothetical protein